MKKWLLFPSFVFFLFCGCQDTGNEDYFPEMECSIQTDSFVSYPLLDYVHHCEFSPFEKDKLWLFAENLFHELDLQTGEIKQFDTRSADFQFSNKQIFPDEYDRNYIWLLTWRGELLRINQKTKESTAFMLTNHMPYFAFTPSTVWVASGQDLFRYDRTTGEIKQEKAFPDMHINSLRLRGDSLIVNYKTYYLPATGTIGAWQAPWVGMDCNRVDRVSEEKGHVLASVITKDGQRMNYVWTKRDKLWNMTNAGVNEVVFWRNEAWTCTWYCKGLYKIDLNTGEESQFPLFGDNNHNSTLKWEAANSRWIIGSFFEGMDHAMLLFDKKKQRFFYLPSPWGESSGIVKMDERNLYLSFPKRFEIVNIDWLARKAIPAEQYLQELDFLEKIRPEFRLDDLDYASFRSAHDSLRVRYGHVKKPIVQTMLKQVWDNYAVSAILKDKASIQLAIKDLESGRLKTGEAQTVIEALFKNYGREVDLNRAQKWGERYRTFLKDNQSQSSTSDGYVSERLDAVKRAKFRYDSISRYSLSADARLYAEADILQEYCYNSGWFFGEGGCANLSLSYQKWDEIILQYPRSEWADNAMFNKLDYACLSCGDQWPADSAVLWKRILDKYPDTELKPSIWQKMAGIYYYGSEYEEKPIRLKHIKSAKHYLNMLSLNFPTAVGTDDVAELKKIIATTVSQLAWEVTLVSEQKEIHPGAPVRITFFLKNTSDETQRIEIGDQNLLFIVNHMPEYGCELLSAPVYESKVPLEKSKREIIVLPGKAYRETLDLTQDNDKVRIGVNGRFDFSQKGMYDVSLSVGGHYSSGSELSEAVRIFVK